MTLVWVAIGYFGLFDMGLSRALTQVIAARLGEGKTDQGQTIFTALTIAFLLGLVGGAILALLAPWLVRSALSMSGSLQPEAFISFLLVAVTVPVITTAQGLRGILEGYQRFDIVNAVRIPLNALTFAGPVLALPISDSLIAGVVVLVACRIASGAFYLWYCLKLSPDLRGGARFAWHEVMPLVRISGWMTVTNVVGPLMVYLDRFLIGAVISVTATAYYSTPYDVVTRLTIFGQAISGALFPAFAMAGGRDPDRGAFLLMRGITYTFMLVFPPVLIAVGFAYEILALWLDPDFAAQSAPVLRIIAVGVLANSIALIPFVLIQGVGRADLIARLHLAELPIYLLILWLGISQWGIAGAAAAWTLRTVADMCLLIMISRYFVEVGRMRVGHIALAAALSLVAILMLLLVPDVMLRLVLAAALLVGFALLSWYRFIGEDLRQRIVRWQFTRG